jgi:hypothetical protein
MFLSLALAAGCLPGSIHEPAGANTAMRCPTLDDLGKMDTFFAQRCGVDALCHGAGSPWTDLQSPEVFKRLLDARSRAACNVVGSDAKIIDKANWENSVLLVKTRETPVCPPGTMPSFGPGFPMPPPLRLQDALMPTQPPLTADERLCIESFVRAATGN